MDASSEGSLMNEEPGVSFPQEKPPVFSEAGVRRTLSAECIMSKTGVVDLGGERFLRIKFSCAFHEARGSIRIALVSCGAEFGFEQHSVYDLLTTF
ncbi:hypothetical protein CEXT_588511 [Caerostris extrusa]|uniref:Uncharacterized protein n=1 Tax=Caerostris extrusa TaxID=172846 RepID=A0AAV4UBF8_CAEEX|nr:hypothetical protein CEXT_588511 [Caerostris extrusa]